MKLLDMTGKVYTVAQAKRVANQLQANECDNWQYRVELDRNAEFARVNVYDESGTLVGQF